MVILSPAKCTSKPRMGRLWKHCCAWAPRGILLSSLPPMPKFPWAYVVRSHSGHTNKHTNTPQTHTHKGCLSRTPAHSPTDQGSSVRPRVTYSSTSPACVRAARHSPQTSALSLPSSASPTSCSSPLPSPARAATLTCWEPAARPSRRSETSLPPALLRALMQSWRAKASRRRPWLSHYRTTARKRGSTR